MFKIKSYFILLIFPILFSCATVPQESVELSTAIGVGLKKQYKSQIDLVDLHFSIKRQMLDVTMQKALKTYFEELTPNGTITLDRDKLNDVATDVIGISAKNNAAKEELEKARKLLLKILNDNFLALNLANSSITGLLQSAVSVQEASSEAFKSLSKMTEEKIDLEKIFDELDKFVLKGGEEAGKVTKLLEKIKELIEKENQKEE